MTKPKANAAPAGYAVETVPTESVRPYPKNPRQNTAAIAKVAESIRQFGFRQPIVVDGKGVVIAGHTRLAAAQLLRLPTVPIHRATNLKPAQVAAYRLADNRTGAEATWDRDLLAEALAGLQGVDFDMPALGFDTTELAELLDPSFRPSLEPALTLRDVGAGDLARAADALADQYTGKRELEPTMCPKCGERFFVDAG